MLIDRSGGGGRCNYSSENGVSICWSKREIFVMIWKSAEHAEHWSWFIRKQLGKVSTWFPQFTLHSNLHWSVTFWVRLPNAALAIALFSGIDLIALGLGAFSIFWRRFVGYTGDENLSFWAAFTTPISKEWYSPWYVNQLNGPWWEAHFNLHPPPPPPPADTDQRFVAWWEAHLKPRSYNSLFKKPRTIHTSCLWTTIDRTWSLARSYGH